MRSWMGLFLFGVMALAGTAYEAQAVEVNVGVGAGRRSGGSFSFSTGDSSYRTWYPETRTYVYTQPTYYAPTVYVAPAPVYTYRTESVQYNGWYGNDRYRSYNHNSYYNNRRDDHNRRR